MHLHRRVGERLEAGYGAQAGEIAAERAVHFERGGETTRAVYYWQQVAEHAAHRNAHHEAIAAFNKALTLLMTMPDSSERARQELALQLALGELLMPAKDFAAPEVGQIYTRAHTLCQQVGEMPQVLRVLWGLFMFHGTQAQLHTASELGQQLLQLAQRQPDTGFIAEGYFAVGGVALYRGDLITARAHLERSLLPPDRLRSPSPALRGGFVPGTMPLICMAQALWALGYADQAQQRIQEALILTRQAEHPLSLAFVEVFATLLSQFRRDVAATNIHAEALMTLATAQGFPLRLEQGRMLQGWALAMSGDAAAGVAQIRQGLTASQGVGPELIRPYWLSLLAEAYGQAGQSESGLEVLIEALALAAITGARWWEAELHRLKGALLLQLPSPDVYGAEACLQQALAVARSQQAKALELRAALSLSHLWQRQGKRDEACQLLAAIYGWFTEGFETSDLQEAKALLNGHDS